MRSLAQYAFSIGTAAAFLAGCSAAQSPLGPTDVVPQTRALPAASCPCLYVANVDLGGRVTSYPLDAHGNVKPIQQISGDKTHLAHPHGIAVDKSGKIYVANNAPTSVTVYAAGATGNAKPSQTISGAKTELSYPFGIAVDPANGDVYVANAYAGLKEKGSVTIYAPGASGDAAPIGAIQGAKTGLDSPHYVALDADGNIEATNSNNTVTVYSAGSTGNVAPIRTIRGSLTKTKDPIELTIDAGLNTYVANYAGNSLTVFAPGASGNVAPVQDIHGHRTQLRGALGVAVDSDGNIYVGSGPNAANGIVTVYATGSNGNARPIRTIEGTKTGLASPAGLAIH